MDTGTIGYTRHKMKTNNTKSTTQKIKIWATRTPPENPCVAKWILHYFHSTQYTYQLFVFILCLVYPMVPVSILDFFTFSLTVNGSSKGIVIWLLFYILQTWSTNSEWVCNCCLTPIDHFFSPISFSCFFWRSMTLPNSNQQTQSYKFTSHIAAFLFGVLITQMLEICIQTSYDQNVQLILKSYKERVHDCC
jgi:hypothetical protein